jgi:hypothetical protein
MLCLWVLFESAHTECKYEGISFDGSNGPRTPLEQLKDNDELEIVANQLIDSLPLLSCNAEQRIRLKEFFKLTVQLSPENRTSDVGNLVGLLNQER